MKQSLNEEFSRMQKLAGVTPNNDILLETLFEYYLYNSYYSKGIFKENLSESFNFSDLKGKAKEKFENFKKKFKNFKPDKKLNTFLFAKLRTLFKNEKDFNEIVNGFFNTFDPINKNKKPTTKEIENWLTKNSDKQLNEFFIDSQAARTFIAIILAAIWGSAHYQQSDVDAIKQAIKDSSTITQTVKTTPGLDSDNAITFTDALKDAGDLSPEGQQALDDATSESGGDTNPVTVSDDADGGKIIKIGYKNGEYKVTDKAKVVSDIVNDILNDIPEGETADSIDISYKGNISNTPGEGDDNPNGPGEKDLAKFRNAVGDDLKDDIEKELKKSPKIGKDAKINFKNDGTNVGDTGDETEKDSPEAEKNQNTSFKVDIKIKDKPVEKTPEGPKDALWFLKPRNVQSEGNKFEALIAYILPDIIKKETYNAFTKDFSQFANKKAPKKAGISVNFKGLTKTTLEDYINSNELSDDTKQILKWVLEVGNDPQSIGEFLNSLDPNMPPIPGNLLHANPESTNQGGSMYSQLLAKTDGTGDSALGSVDITLGSSSQGVSPTGTNPKTGKKLEEFKLFNLYGTLLTEANVGDFTSLPGYDESKAKKNLGRLVLLYTWIWGVQYPTREDDNVDNISERNAVAYVIDPKNKYGAAISELDNLYPIIYTKIDKDLSEPEPESGKEKGKPKPESDKEREPLVLDIPEPEPNKEREPLVLDIPEPESDVKNISKFNRNGQIGFVLARTSPKLNIYSELGEKNITNLTDNNLNDIIKGEYKGNQTSDNAKKLAKLILNLRKSPDSLTKKYANILGVTLKPRAKAISTQPGKGTQAQLQKVQEIKNRTLLYLTEAMIDDIFSEFGVTDDDIISKKVQLLSLLGSMYASEEDNTLSILDTKSLSDKEKQQLQGLGFSPQAGGNYVFLGKGQTKASYFDKLQDKNKTQPDINRIISAIERDPQLKSYLNKIDTKDELANFILALFLHRNNNGETLFNPDQKFATDSGKVRAALFGLNNRIPNKIEEEDQEPLEDLSPDVKKAYDRIEQSSALKNLLKNINTLEEFYQLVLRSILPLINKKFKTKTGVSDLKSAIAIAANKASNYKNLLNPKSTTKPSSTSTSNTSSTGTTNVNYTLTKENKNMKKPLLSEEFKRMRKLAGIITEEMIGGVNFDAQAAAEIKLEQPDLSKLAPFILDKGDKVTMTNSGKICIYDGSTLKKTYNDVESFLTGISYNPMKLK